MRARAFILTLSLVLIGGVSFAGNGERAFRKKINKFIHFPSNVSKKIDTKVYVEFTVLESLEIRIDAILCENEEYAKSITKQLKKIVIDPNNTEVINKTFVYKFNLVVEK